jgi:CHAT domain-containing protein
MILNCHRLMIVSGFILCCTGMSAQSTAMRLFAEGDALHGLSDNAGALEKFDSSRSEAFKAGEFTVYFDAFGMLLDCLHKKSEIRLLQAEIVSFDYHLKHFRDKISSPDYRAYVDVSSLFTILVYKALGDSDGALSLLMPLLDSVDALIYSPDSVAILNKKFKLLLYISEAYMAQGNYEQTLYYANEAIVLSTWLTNKDGWLLVPHNTLVSNYVATGRTEEAIEELNLILDLLPGIEQRRTERTVDVYLKISNLHLKNGSLDSALYYLNLLKGIDKTGSHKIEADILEGEIYYAGEEYEKSKSVYLNVRNVLTNAGAERSEFSAKCNLQLGKIAIKQGRPKDALVLLHTALLNFTEHFEDSNPVSTPTTGMLYSRLTPVEIIYYKSKVLFELYRDIGDAEYLVSSWKTANLGIDFVVKLRESYFVPEDKAILIERSYSLFEHALRICHYQLSFPYNESWVDTAFTLMERSKALNLMDAVMHENARQFAGIPDSMLKTESALRIEISGQEESIRQLKISKNYSKISLQKNISDLGEKRRSYRALLKSIETDHPSYYQLRYGVSETGLDDIQDLAKEDETVIDYFMGESEIYTLIIEKDRKQLFLNHNAKEIENLVVSYRSSIQKCIDGEGSSANDTLYLNTAIALYESLITPLLPLRNSLMIVQDGALNYLSFAGLITEDPSQYRDYRIQPFMVLDYEISYCYSMSLYHELRRKKRSKSDRCIVFAPQFDTTGIISQLTYSAEEAMLVAQQTDGQMLMGEKCTTAAVRGMLQNAPGYQIVHFATHGVANISNGTDSYLQFAGPPDSSRLYGRELYNYSLDANLVYLSACETGGGQLRRGEGIISIAQAFFYAGTRSLVTALWSISDERASDLTVGFYDELMSGQSVDASVARAQRRYLKSIPNEERYLAHPAYWSALVPIGSSSAIVAENDLFWLVFLAALLIVVFILRRFLRKNPVKG